VRSEFHFLNLGRTKTLRDTRTL